MTNDEPARTRVKEPEHSQRLLSLDALRGFDMFWIIGGDALSKFLSRATDSSLLDWWGARAGAWGFTRGQMFHANWHGFTAYDLIFPLFLFIAGVAMPFSFAKRQATGDSARVHWHVVRRGLLLVLFGMIYNGFLQFPGENTRFCSVLGRIGLAYMFAGLIFLHTDWRKQIAIVVGLLLGYWALLMAVPYPGGEAGAIDDYRTIVAYLDRMLIPGRFYVENAHDPEGLVGTIPAIATALMGALTGTMLRCTTCSPKRKVQALFGLALALLLVGWLWGLVFPHNKNLWTSSFAVFCAGWSVALLGVFYGIIDVLGWRRWSYFFVVIGANSIFIYLATVMIDFSHTAQFLLGGLIGPTRDATVEPAVIAMRSAQFSVGVIALEWLLLWVMYKKRIFLRV